MIIFLKVKITHYIRPVQLNVQVLNCRLVLDIADIPTSFQAISPCINYESNVFYCMAEELCHLSLCTQPYRLRTLT